nr:MAG TPA: Endodeoxyribonuclease RusA [Caudoviricetes sp.]
MGKRDREIPDSCNEAKVSGGSMKITIPEIPPSLNKYAGRLNGWEYRTEKQRWIGLMRAYCKKQKPMEKAIVTITYYFPTRHRHDPDNYNGKMLMDGLTDRGVISDDSFDHVELRLRGAYDPKNPRTEIDIEEDTP